MMNGLFLAFFLVFILFFFLFALFLDSKEVSQAGEVFFHDESHALSVEAVACEVSVVGLVVDMDGEVAVGEDEVA